MELISHKKKYKRKGKNLTLLHKMFDFKYFGYPEKAKELFIKKTSEEYCPEKYKISCTHNERFYLTKAGYFAAISRKAGKCKQCGSSEKLTVHHKHRHGLGGSNRPENLIVLCRVCHDKIHNGGNNDSH